MVVEHPARGGANAAPCERLRQPPADQYQDRENFGNIASVQLSYQATIVGLCRLMAGGLNGKTRRRPQV